MKEELSNTAIYQAVFETSLAGFFVLDDSGTIVKANATAELMFGYENNELVKKNIYKLFANELIKDLMQSRVSESLQIYGLRKDGGRFMVDIRFGSTVIQDSTLGIVFCKPADISVFESDRKLRTLVDNVSGIVYRCSNDRDWTMKYISDGCETITGFSPHEFLEGKVHFSDIIYEADQNHIWDATQEALHNKEPYQFSFRVKDKLGNTKYLNELGRGVYNSNGYLLFLEGLITDITYLKQTEYALEKEKKILNQYLNAAASIFLIINKNHTIELINQKGREILGYPQNEIIGKNWFHNCIPKKEKKELTQLFGQIISGVIEPPDIYENWVLAKGNRRKLIRWRNALLKDENGNITGLISSGLEVTEQVFAEQKLRESEEKNRAILQAMPDVVSIYDKKGTILEIHVPDDSSFRISKEELVGENITNLFFEEVGKKLKSIISKVIHNQEMATLELASSVADDTVIYEYRLVPFNKNQVLSIARNITETNTIQSSLHLRNRALEAAGNGVIIVDAQQPDLPILYSNRAFSLITGYQPSEVLGENCRFLQKDDHDQEGIRTLAIAIQNGKPCKVVLRNYRKDGTLFWNELTITPLYNEKQQLTHFIGVQNDITEIQNTKAQLETYADKLESKVAERTKEIEATVQKLIQTNLSLEDQVQVTKIAEDKAKRSQVLFAAIARNFPKGLIVVFNTDFELVYVEGEELKRANLEKTDFEGKHIDDITFFSKNQVKRIKQNILKTVKGDNLSFELEFQTDCYALNAKPLRSDGDDIVWALFVFNNITEQKNVREELTTTLKAAEELIGLKSRFISMASHEFRTPLSAILSSAILIGKQNEPGKEERREKHVARIRTHVKHLVVILNDFLSLSKLEEGRVKSKPQHLELIQFCKIIVDEMELTKKEGQAIILKYTEAEIPVFLDPKLLNHILVNLLSNALKYSEAGQEIKFELKEIQEHIIFEITDNGMGIPKAEQGNLFERFFRAENAINIEGTGLGLHIVKQYSELMHGAVSFKSKRGKGSTFTVKLPLNLHENEKNIDN